MVRVAVSGGIAEGKTTVLNILQTCGAYTLGSDVLVHELLNPGTDPWQRVKQTFGDEVIDEKGAIRRDRLADIVFASPDARRKLNRLLHPSVLREVERRYRQHPDKQAQAGIFAVEVPLLIEVAWQDWFDRIIVVQASPEIQQRRLKQRGMPLSMIDAVLRSQLATRAKVPFADWIVRTQRPLSAVEKQVRQIWALLNRPLCV